MLLIVGFGFALPTYSEESAGGPPTGKAYIAPGVIYFKPPKTDDFEVGPGLAVGYSFTDRIAMEVLLGKTDAEI